MALRARAERLEAHHKVPIEELQPDSITPVTEMAMVCATCHRVIHSAKPCLTIEQVRALGKLALAIGVSAAVGYYFQPMVELPPENRTVTEAAI